MLAFSTRLSSLASNVYAFWKAHRKDYGGYGAGRAQQTLWAWRWVDVLPRRLTRLMRCDKYAGLNILGIVYREESSVVQMDNKI